MSSTCNLNLKIVAIANNADSCVLLIADTRDFCMHESFTARCEPDSVVLMLSAVYGRMRLGRCIRGDYNVGCSTDVVAFFDAHCTGRRSCQVGVRNLIDIHPCQRDFTSYLEASYRCIRGIPGAHLTSLVLLLLLCYATQKSTKITLA